ncbi:unnamed protein product [Echinostoma caproni]|uniref:SSXT domain-containing protein n=1 Tax=Echinostoma caproni TaxID=27848 RepID=A0A183ALW3_9TREM|nr:unnamed protein product [Echinostoma caproni]
MMSAVFSSDVSHPLPDPESTSVKRLLDENEYIIQLISELSRKGNFVEAAQMQLILQRNLTYLVSLVDRQSLEEISSSLESTGPRQ